ncbi:DUF3048 domain-containing protein [Chryseomicrobium palamuruense]|uniref:DUF3048 domain-containing protein n=1 Tax=Chryseomicrobium palamuruense TaxID=682973 RepID=A0ABV8UWP6_9BACL
MKYWGILLLCVVVLLGGCRNKQEAESLEPEVEQEEVEIIEAEEPEQIEEDTVEEEFPFFTPLSGEPAKEQVLNRPVVVTINNHPLARPQSGLKEADIIYEMLAEGSVTRLLAVYQSEYPGRVGPIRSARDYFIHVAKGFDAFYIAHGYSPDAKSMLNRGEIAHMNGMQYDGTYFQRSSARKAPHNSYSSGGDIVKGAEKVGTALTLEEDNLPSLHFSEDVTSVDETEEAGSVTVSFSSDRQFIHHYSYDHDTGFYSRETAGLRTVDAETSEELQLANVVFLEMPHRVIDSEGRLALNLSDGGNAWLFRDGKRQSVEWINEDGLLVVVSGEKPVALKPGQTWVHFIPAHRGLEAMVTYTN